MCFGKYISIKHCRSTPEYGNISKTCTPGFRNTFKKFFEVFLKIIKNCHDHNNIGKSLKSITYFLICFWKQSYMEILH